MRLPRPYIPLYVRVVVAERQMRDQTGCEVTDERGIPLRLTKTPLRKRLDLALFHIGVFGTQKLELHHRPALVNRERYVRRGKTLYYPPANDPDFLIYLNEDEHAIETRVRGVGAQRSDLAQARYNKRVARNRTRIKKPRKYKAAPFRWPKRKIPGGRPWRSA